jgi:hypothetical protein
MSAIEKHSIRPVVNSPISKSDKQTSDERWSQAELDYLALHYQTHSSVDARDFVQPRFTEANAAQQKHQGQRRNRHAVDKDLEQSPLSKLTVTGLVAATIMIGSAVGFVAGRPGVMQFENMAAQANSLAAGTTKKHVLTAASLQVRDIFGQADSPISLEIVPPTENESLAYRFTGLPADAYLTAGVEIAKGNWLVRAQDLPNVGIVVPDANNTSINLEISAIESKSGEIASPIQLINLEIGKKEPLPLPAKPVRNKALVKAIAPLQAIGNPGVAAEDKSNQEEVTIMPASAEPVPQVKNIAPKKPKKVLLDGN